MYDSYGELGAQQSLTHPFTIENTKKTNIWLYNPKQKMKPRALNKELKRFLTNHSYHRMWLGYK
jgi:hypothetical protein